MSDDLSGAEQPLHLLELLAGSDNPSGVHIVDENTVQVDEADGRRLDEPAFFVVRAAAVEAFLAAVGPSARGAFPEVSEREAAQRVLLMRFDETLLTKIGDGSVARLTSSGFEVTRPRMLDRFPGVEDLDVEWRADRP